VFRPAHADTYPSRPVHLLVGGAAGSVPDTVARLIGERLAAALGYPVIVENRPGAGGILAIQELISSVPDGHTLALATMSQAVFNSYLFSKLPYDPLRDLEPISPLVSGAFALAAHPSFHATNLTEFVQAAKAAPGKVLLATTTRGNPPHVSALMLTRTAGIEVTFVPFRSGQEGLGAVLRGDVPVFLDAPTLISPQAKEGALKVLAVTGREREPELPGVQTVAEAGFPAAQSEAWIGLVAPARTNSDVIARLNAEVTNALMSLDLRQRLRALSFAAVPAQPEEFRRLIVAEHARWGAVIKEVGLRLD
jgi:tripartite-type tricarboxylate transporter receptor subunit TctC